jgi:hypothetical protein
VLATGNGAWKALWFPRYSGANTRIVNAIAARHMFSHDCDVLIATLRNCKAVVDPGTQNLISHQHKCGKLGSVTEPNKTTLFVGGRFIVEDYQQHGSEAFSFRY